MNFKNELYNMDEEWESMNFPLTLTHVNCKNGYYNLPYNSIIQIDRDEQFRFIGSVSGSTYNRGDWEYRAEGYTRKSGEFIENEIIFCEDISTNKKYELDGCHLGGFSVGGYNSDNGFLHTFTVDLHLNEVIEVDCNLSNVAHKVIDFYFVGRTKLFPSGSTERFLHKSNGIIRKRIFKGEKVDKNAFGPDIISFSGSQDCVKINLNGFSFIIQFCSNEIIPDWANALLIEYCEEYGPIPADNIRAKIPEIVGFLIGTQLLEFANSVLDKDNNVFKRKALQCTSTNIKDHCQNFAVPPLKYKRSRSYAHLFEDVAENTIPTYLKMAELLQLDLVLWKYWVAQEMALGDNLPILSSALEGLAKNYIEVKNLKIKVSNQEREQYSEYLKLHQSFIDGLKNFSFSEPVINKITNPYNLGSNERFKVFFKDLNISFDKKSIENKALLSRNEMAHGSSRVDKPQVVMAKKMSNAYLSLFNRVFLKIMGHSGTYTDFYTIGKPDLTLDQNMG